MGRVIGSFCCGSGSSSMDVSSRGSTRIGGDSSARSLRESGSSISQHQRCGPGGREYGRCPATFGEGGTGGDSGGLISWLEGLGPSSAGTLLGSRMVDMGRILLFSGKPKGFLLQLQLILRGIPWLLIFAVGFKCCEWYHFFLLFGFDWKTLVSSFLQLLFVYQPC